MTDITSFISYSWDSDDHKAWTLRLATALHEMGVYVHIDQWDILPGMDIPHYMETKIRDSSFVLLICTPAFAEKANKGIGGVGFEKSIVTGEIFYSAPTQTKFVPVLRSGEITQSVPTYLKSKAYVDMRKDQEFDIRTQELFRVMHGIPAANRPAVGSKPIIINSANQNTAPDATSKKPDSATSDGGVSRAAKFDVEQFKELVDFAYSSEGLNLTKSSAVQWAEDRLKANPRFDLRLFRELLDFAYGTDGLNLTKSGAVQWAEDRLKEAPRFDVARFKEVINFAYGTDGLNMTKSSAVRWAEDRLREDPQFDVGHFKKLFDVAYNSSELNMTKGAAIKWAEAKLKGDRDPQS